MRIQYRLLSLEFWNGKPENARRLGFTSAMILHDPERNAAVIDGIRAPESVRDGLLDKLSPYPVRAIRYEIQADDFPAIPFCHPFPEKAKVMLGAVNNDPDQLFLSRKNGKPFFSDNFALRDITEGRINSSQRVYQFHE